MTKSNKNFDYRALKKALSKYFDFSFKLHAKKKITPQQKSAITRKYLKILPYIDGNFNPLTDEVTFLKYPKGSKLAGVDGIRTDAGLFYKWPQAKLVKDKKTGKYVIVVAPKILKGAIFMEKRRDYFYPFPKSIINDIGKIQLFVEKLQEKYDPHDIMWSTTNLRERQAYLPETFELYFSQYFAVGTEEQEFGIVEPQDIIDVDNLSDDELLNDDAYNDLNKFQKAKIWRVRKMRQKAKKKDNYYNGVFLIYYLN